MDEPQVKSSRYWVLLGTPQGPWSMAEILDKLKAGVIEASTTVCQIGQQAWVPLHTLAEFGEFVPPPLPSLPTLVEITAAAPSAVTEAQATINPPLTPPARPKRQQAILLVIGTVFGIAGMTWVIAIFVEWVAPGPERVANKFMEAETVAEAKKWSTPRMYPVLEALLADKTPSNPNDEAEITTTTDGPSGSKLVGFRGKFFVPEAGQRVAMEGHIRLVKTEGWKVDDIVINGVEGIAMEGPMSYVDMHAAEQAAKRAEASARSPATTPKTFGSGKPFISKGTNSVWKGPPPTDWLEQNWKKVALFIVCIMLLGGHEAWKGRRKSSNSSAATSDEPKQAKN